MGRDPMSGEVFLLQFPSYLSEAAPLGGGGFVLYHKRFEQGILSLPAFDRETGGYRITWHELVLLIEGVSLERTEGRSLELPAESKRIGEEITELLEYKPGELYIRRLIRPKYALPNGEGVVIAELPSLPLPRTNAGPSMLAQLLVGKYQDYIQVDESIIPVMAKDKPGATYKGYHWVVRSPELKSLFFHYDKGSRAQYVAGELLKDFRGAVQSDGYGAYNIYENKDCVLLLGCWAHARRKFEAALDNDPGRAEYALGMIRQLYAIERQAQDENLPLDEIQKRRKAQAYPLIRDFERWLEAQARVTMPQSLIGKAVRYAYSIYSRLSRYVVDGRYRIDNNLAENAVRPLALGRKNYLFCRNHQAAYRTAIVYSLLGTCRLWNIDPTRWFTDGFSRIQDCSIRRLEELLPHKWAPLER